MNTAKERAGSVKREEQDREAQLVAAADRGARDFYKVSGYGRLLAIGAAAAALAVFAQWKLRHQDYLFGSLAVFAAVFVLSLFGSAMPYGVRKRARNEARSVRRAATRMLRRNRSRIPEAAAQEVERGIRGVDEALKGSRTGTAALEARTRLDASTLLVGDFIFVNKMAYGLRIPFTDPSHVHKIGEGAPKRGDVVVFIVPQHPDVDYVKRVVGLPGDHIEIRENVVYINGVEQKREYLGEYRYTEHSEYTDTDIEVTTDEYVEDLDGVRHPVLQRKDAGFARNMSFVVDPGRLFMMGDNRDNSADSRVEGGIGQIPFSYVKGRASIIWISFGGRAGIRFERIFRAVH